MCIDSLQPTAAEREARASSVGTPNHVPRRRRARWLELRGEVSRTAYRSFALAGFVAAFAAWTLISRAGLIDSVFLPSPAAVWEAALQLVREPALWIDVRASALRVTAGFLLAAALGVPLGIAIGSFKLIEGLLQPLSEFIRYIPVPALVPILMVLFGIDELSKVMLIFAGTFFQLVLMVADEVRRVPHALVQISYTLGATRAQVIRLVLWRSAMPGVFDALRLCNGWAWTYLVVAELMAANEGLGYRILKFSRFLQTPKIWVYLILLGVIGLGLDLLFRRLNRRLFHWAEQVAR